MEKPKTFTITVDNLVNVFEEIVQGVLSDTLDDMIEKTLEKNFKKVLKLAVAHLLEVASEHKEEK